MPLAPNIIRELRTHFFSLDRKNVMSGDLKPAVDDSLRLGAPDKKYHAIYVNRLVADEIEGADVGGGEATGGHADTLGDDYLTATESAIDGNLYPLGTGARFETSVLPADVAYEGDSTTVTFGTINVTNYVDGIKVSSHDHSGGANMGVYVSHGNLVDLSADHHTIYTRWDDAETVIKKWIFSNKADQNQGFNKYVGWEIEASVVLTEDGGVYYPEMSTAQAVFQTLAYTDPHGVATVSVNAGGTGYAVDDILTIIHGNNDATLKVLTLSGSAVATVKIVLPGSGYTTTTGAETTVEPSGGSGCTIDVDTITSYGSYEHSYPLKIISHAEYAAISLGPGAEILFKTNSSDTWVDVGNITLSDEDGITVGSDFAVTQAGIMTATAGFIGAWEILDDKLKSSSEDVVLDSNGYIYLRGDSIELRMSSIHADYRLWVGGEGESNFDATTAKFLVNTAGNVTAETVAVKGLIHNFGADKWKITSDGHAEFESISCRGRLDTLVFTKSTVSSIAGVLALANGGILADVIHAAGAIDEIDLNAGGSGYAIGDTFYINGGDTTATLAVTSVSSGAVETYNISTVGSGYSTGTGVATTTITGSGTGCTIDIDSIYATDDTEIYLDAPEFGFGDIVLLQPSADNMEWMLVISSFTQVTIQNVDGEDVIAYKYTVSRDFDEFGSTFSFQKGVSVNGRGSYSVGNDPLPLASGDEQGVFGEYQPSGTFTGAGGGWITLDGESTHITVNVRTGPLPDQYQQFVRIGNLQGMLTYTEIEYGFAVGDENEYLSYDETKGLVYYSRSGVTTINEDGITSDAFIISLAGTEPASADTDTAILYYYDDKLKMLYDDTGSEELATVLMSVNGVVNVPSAAAPYFIYYEDDTADHWWRTGVDSGQFFFDYDDDQDGLFSPYSRVFYLTSTKAVADRLEIQQTADNSGMIIYGYDDKSAEYLSSFIASDGTTYISTSNNVIIANASGYLVLRSAGSIYNDLGDAAGVQKTYFRDSAYAIVATIDSDGGAKFKTLEIELTAGYDACYDNVNSGTAKTINWTLGNVQKVTATGNCTFTFTAPPKVGHLTLVIIGNGTDYTFVFPETVEWVGAGEPSWNFTSAKKNIVSFLYDGTDYIAAGGEAV